MMLNDYQLKQLLAYLGTAFPGELSDAEAKVWIETFEESAAPFATAYDALKKLKRVKMFRPTHADFFEAVESRVVAVVVLIHVAGPVRPDQAVAGGSAGGETHRGGSGREAQLPTQRAAGRDRVGQDGRRRVRVRRRLDRG